jgi:hypothetical protein
LLTRRQRQMCIRDRAGATETASAETATRAMRLRVSFFCIFSPILGFTGITR